MKPEDFIIEQGEVVCYLNGYIDEIWLGDAEEVDAFILKLTELSNKLKEEKK
ncbi:hypothetical protein [Erwinia phage FBB1]|nr:hypothetical protein [Erwinia phage FBB1]